MGWHLARWPAPPAVRHHGHMGTDLAVTRSWAVRRFASAARQRARRRFKTPFASAGQRPLLLHAAHHRAGTVWFFNVYRRVAYGMRAVEVPTADGMPHGADVALFHHAGDVGRTIDDHPVRGTHMVRDPRDVVASSYFYHCWTHEPWAHRPDERYAGRTYQEHLKGLDESDGLMAELDRYLGWEVQELTNWHYDQPNFLELRYEDVLADEESSFRQIFKFFGFRPQAVERAVSVAREQSFQRVAKRPLGQAADGQHLRSGRAGQWRRHFEPRHVEAFKQGAGDVLQQLGYETDDDWG